MRLLYATIPTINSGLNRFTVPAQQDIMVLIDVFIEARPRERSDRDRFLPLGQKGLFIPGCVRGAIFLLVCRYVCACV